MLIKMFTKQNNLHNKTLYLPGAKVSSQVRTVYTWHFGAYISAVRNIRAGISQAPVNLALVLGLIKWLWKMDWQDLAVTLVIAQDPVAELRGIHSTWTSYTNSQKFATTQVLRTGRLWASCLTSMSSDFYISKEDMTTPTAASQNCIRARKALKTSS